MKHKIGTKQFAKAGALARWGSRHDMLQELRKHVDPVLYVHLPKWPTEHLKTLLKAYQK